MIQQHIILALLWIIFCALHSILASTGFKRKVQQQLGTNFKYYRLYYTLFAFVTLIAVFLYQFNIASPYIYKVTQLSYIIGGFVAIMGLVIMAICIKKYFAQLSGLKTLFIDEVKTGNTLIITGIHKYVRHPLYLGTFIFIWGLFIVFPYLSLLIADTIITVYTLIGIVLEEQKLIAEFGEDYKLYKQQVPKIIPFFKRSKVYF